MAHRNRSAGRPAAAFTPPGRRAILVPVKGRTRFFLRSALGAAALSLSGCSAAGGIVQGVGGLIEGLLSLAVSLLPFALAYYLYRRNRD